MKSRSIHFFWLSIMFLISAGFVQGMVLHTPDFQNNAGDIKDDSIPTPCQKAPDSVVYEDLRYKWIKVTCDADFPPRDGAGALVYRNSMWLLGGWNRWDTAAFPMICNNEVWNSTDGRNWKLVKENTFKDKSFDPRSDWEGRHAAGYAVYKGKMWIIGGDPNQGHYQNDVWASVDGKKWALVTDKVPWANRVLHMTAVFENKLWVMGGQTMSQYARSEDAFYSDIWNTTDGVIWNKVDAGTCRWLPRGMIGGSVIYKDRMWILGGGTYETKITLVRKLYNDIWSTGDGINWQCHTQEADWQIRCYHDVAVWDDKMWILEGTSCGQIRAPNSRKAVYNRNDVWFSTDGEHWTELPDTPWQARHASSIFVYDDCLWVVAGNNMESDVWKLCKF